MGFAGSDFISINDFSKADLEHVFKVADRMLPLARKGSSICKNKVLATLFYEPSTRTRLSFQTAMLRLGGRRIGFSSGAESSSMKGETIADTVRTIEQYSDIIVIRHPSEGAARVAADYASIPVINAGDGSHQHPTQTVLDLYTILKEKGKIKGLNVGLYGDLKYGRTVHSLLGTLGLFGANVFCVSPQGLEMPVHFVKEFKEKHGGDLVETSSLDTVLPQLDVLYATRIQKERFPDEKEFLKVKGTYSLDSFALSRAKDDLVLLHPLPRVDEISYELDADPRSRFFKQVFYGVPTRMALIALLLGKVK